MGPKFGANNFWNHRESFQTIDQEVKVHLLLLCSQINLNFWRRKSWRFNKVKIWVPANRIVIKFTLYIYIQIWCLHNFSLPCKFSSKIEEGLLEVIIALCRNLIVLEVLLPVECNLLCFNLPVLHINLVSTENNRNILTDPGFWDK